jgi:hypothetical protein
VGSRWTGKGSLAPGAWRRPGRQKVPQKNQTNSNRALRLPGHCQPSAASVVVHQQAKVEPLKFMFRKHTTELVQRIKAALWVRALDIHIDGIKIQGGWAAISLSGACLNSRVSQQGEDTDFTVASLIYQTAVGIQTALWLDTNRGSTCWITRRKTRLGMTRLRSH